MKNQLIVLLTTAVLLGGCAQLGAVKDGLKSVETKAYDAAATAAEKYCVPTLKAAQLSESVGVVVREERRQLANEIYQRSGVVVKVYCPGETPPAGLVKDITTKPNLKGLEAVLTGQYRGELSELDPKILQELKELGYDIKDALDE